MELILTQDVASLGIANEVVRVKDGYARNYLLPNRLAVVATKANKIERAEKIQKALEKKEQRITAAQELAERMSRIFIEFTRKSSEEGKLFGSVTKDDIIDQLKTDHLIDIDKKQIHLPVALKTIGETELKVRLDTGVSGILKVVINPEGEEVVEAKKEEVAEVTETAEEAAE